jgi:hypothetical protein
MSTYANDYSGGLGAGLGSGLRTFGFGSPGEPPLSPPMAQAPRTAPMASAENGNGNGLGLIAPLTDQPVQGLLGGTAIVAHAPVEGSMAPAEETTGETTSLPVVDLRAFAIDRSAARLIPEQVATLNTALPIGFEQGLPLVAIAEASEPTMQGVRAALGCDARFVLASRTDLVASIAAAYTTPAAGAIRLATPAGVEPLTVAETAPPVEETMPTIAPIAPVGELELAPAQTEEHAPAEQVELAPVAPIELAPVAPIAPVEEPVDLPAAFETVAPVETIAPVETVAPDEHIAFDTVAPIEAPAAFDTVAPLATVAPVETVAPLETVAPPEHSERAPFTVEPATETTVEQVADVAEEQETGTPTETVETAPTTRFRVVIRLSGAEPVEAGAFDAVGEAKDRAFEIVGQLTSEDGSWPYFRGRYLRPDAIVSVDIVEETAW